MSNDRSSVKGVLDLTATIAIIVASVAVVWAVFRPRSVIVQPPSQPPQARQTVPVPSSPVNLDGAANRGSRVAPVGLIVFSEFQCPYCARFATETLPTLISKYVDTGQVRLVFRNLPLERLHPIAFHAAEVANCADKTGQFWTVHDRFFQEPKVVAATEYDDRATRAGVGADSLGLCLKEGSATRQVQADLKLAEELKLASTPAFLLGKVMSDRLVVSKVILGARPKADFEEAIETELKAVANR